MQSDIEIAQHAEMRPIGEIAEKSASARKNWKITVPIKRRCPWR